MEIDALKQWRIKSNWRAHVTRYTELKKKLDGNYNPEQYCKEKQIDCKAFKLWLEYLEKEDKYVFYISFATEYVSRAERSLKLVKKYMNISELRMPLMHDAIVAYAAPFTKSHGRVSSKRFSLEEIESFVPDSLQAIHKKICDDRNTIVAHCDLEPRNPRVGSVGGLYGISIGTKGYSWSDYRDLMPEFEKLISAVQQALKEYNQRNFNPPETYFRDFLNPPACVDQDPGPPSK